MKCRAIGYKFPNIEWYENSPWKNSIWTIMEAINATWRNYTRNGVFEVTSAIQVIPNENTFRNVYKCFATNDVKRVASEPSEQFLFPCIFTFLFFSLKSLLLLPFPITKLAFSQDVWFFLRKQQHFPFILWISAHTHSDSTQHEVLPARRGLERFRGDSKVQLIHPTKTNRFSVAATDTRNRHILWRLMRFKSRRRDIHLIKATATDIRFGLQYRTPPSLGILTILFRASPVLVTPKVPLPT